MDRCRWIERVKERVKKKQYRNTIFKPTSNYIDYIRAPVDIFDKSSKNYLFLHTYNEVVNY